MRRGDFEAFSEMLDAVCGLLSRGQYTPSAVNTALWFRALADFEIADVRRAFDEHVRDPVRGRFVPVPADILFVLERDDRPGPEEAWAIALKAKDEASTVVWTEEIARAWNVALTLVQSGDEVGARMAFKDAYTREVATAKQQRRRAAWTTSLGWDAPGRADAVKAAVDARRLPYDALQALPAPELTLPPPEIRERLEELRRQILCKPDAPDDAGRAERIEEERNRLRDLKAAAEALVSRKLEPSSIGET